MSKAAKQIKDSSLNYKKGLGQNFIYDEGLLDELAALSGVTKEDRVLEIGPGAGTLTRALARRADRLTALEIDSRLIPLLRAFMADMPNVTIEEGDVLSVNLAELTAPLGEGFSVVANIPYYITTPLITLLLDSGLPIRRIAVMVQQEVADKILAKPGQDSYGMLAVKCQYFSEPEILMHVPRQCFTPVPNVDSAFVLMQRRDAPPVQVSDEKLLFKTAAAAFLMRRKTMLNNLMSSFALPREKALEALKMTGLDEKIRGEKLALTDFAALSDALKQLL